jgi:hypothetical protein
LEYAAGTFKASLSGIVVVSTTVDLFEKFGGWAYFGLTSYFKGINRNVGISWSYICEDDYVSTFYYKWLVGSQVVENASINITAGTGAQLVLKYKDKANLLLPHLSGQGIFDNKIELSDSTGKTTPTALVASTDGYSLTTTIKPAAPAGGPYSIKVTTEKGTFAIEYNVVAADFDHVNLEQPSTTRKTDGKYYLAPEEYSWDDVVKVKNTISLFVLAQDVYDNYKNL